jgi:hypothetical protein
VSIFSKDRAASKGYADARDGKSREAPNGVFESFIFNSNADHHKAIEANESYNKAYDHGDRDRNRK